ncbi:EAL domain-containing protein [Novosphingobium sp.]|uniref:putative bifunctional diguanylate cyclase/phosphodiesterase n=1 Tax=Novosphingobium sp. TaxID=1874826 RepID=UPI00261E3D58|nr:EAL domain-containing protein [Novosphingobium sp.]
MTSMADTAAPPALAADESRHAGSVRRPLPVEQFLRLRKQLPPMYLILTMNAAALAYTHHAVAPRWLSLWLPLVLIIASLVRLMQWLRPIDESAVTLEFAKRTLRRTEIMGTLLSVLFVSWALALDQYGDGDQHGHVTVFVAITVMGCIFCLTYLPRAAHLVCYIVLGVFLTYCLARGTVTMASMALNILMVGVVVLKVLRDSFGSFTALEDSQAALQHQQTQAQRLAEENARLAHSDPLTGLPNRRYFFARLDALLARGDRRAPFTIGVIDLDRFKPINDVHGHAQGDRLLQVIGARLRDASGPDTVIARLGGDEFGLIIEGSIEAAEATGVWLCQRVQEPVPLGDIVVSVGCSGGLAAWPEAGASAHDLFDRADFALYHAKKARRGGIVRFSCELERIIRSEQALEAALQSADLKRELAMVYQPIVRTRAMAMVGVEALARWESPTIGAVPAELLFAAAERLGMARTVTLAAFERVLDDFARLPAEQRLSFNLAPTDIADPGTVAALIERIAHSGIDAQRLVFEITETSLIGDFAAARAALEQLRACGAKIALDDFGTGYSSLSTLHMLPIDIIKIDRSFAARLDDGEGRRLVRAIFNLTRSLRLECVFEGIETELQLMEATLAGFHYAQGYFIERPVALDTLLERRAARAA